MTYIPGTLTVLPVVTPPVVTPAVVTPAVATPPVATSPGVTSGTGTLPISAPQGLPLAVIDHGVRLPSYMSEVIQPIQPAQRVSHVLPHYLPKPDRN